MYNKCPLVLVNRNLWQHFKAFGGRVKCGQDTAGRRWQERYKVVPGKDKITEYLPLKKKKKIIKHKPWSMDLIEGLASSLNFSDRGQIIEPL